MYRVLVAKSWQSLQCPLIFVCCHHTLLFLRKCISRYVRAEERDFKYIPYVCSVFQYVLFIGSTLRWLVLFPLLFDEFSNLLIDRISMKAKADIRKTNVAKMQS